jgi:NAD(P)-dependent dehydrogenase (short-subunit alcohol dehydrogenase family)
MDLKQSLVNKVALVTGAGSGIGKASAKLLGYAGAKVVCVGITPVEVEQTASDISSNGCQALALQADISKEDQVRNIIERTHKTWGRLDIVFANAGINGVWCPIDEMSEQDWDQTLDVNLKGTFLTVKHSLPLLKKQGGSVIITSSVNGTRMFSNTGATAYACSKAAQVAFAKMVALEVAKHRVRVNVICPGWIESKISENTKKVKLEEIRTPVEFPEGTVPFNKGGPGTAGEVAELVWFLACDLSHHISGTEIFIDGAQSLLQG